MDIVLKASHRFAIGLFLVLHGVMHAALLGTTAVHDVARGIVAGLRPPIASTALATILFMVAISGFVTAGIGVWGTPALRRIWSPLTNSAVLASTLLIVLVAPPPHITVGGLAFDAVALALSGATFARLRDTAGA